MDLRLAPTLVLLLAAAATAQPPTPAPQDPPAPTPAPPANQDPDKPQPTPQQELEALTAERQRLQREIEYVRDRARNARAILADKLGRKPETWRAIDAGVMAPPVQAMPPARRPARVASPDELADHGNTVMLLVNGRPIHQPLFDQLMEYLAQGTTAGDASMRAQRALYDLIRIEAVAASFPDEETADRAAALVAQLEGGKSVQDLAREVGTLPGAAADGRIELTRNSMHGPRFEQIAFATPAGARAAPFRTAQGIVILQVEKHEKGETPDTDKVALHAALVPYTADAQALQKVHNAVNFGQIDIVVRDQQTLDQLPPLFRPQPQHSGVPAAAPVPGRDTTALQEALGMLAKEIAALQDATDDVAVAKRRALEARYEQLKRELRSADAGEETDRTAPDKIEPARIEPPKVEPKPTEPPKKQG